MDQSDIHRNMSFIYVIRNLINGKVYVGQTKNLAKRKAAHIYNARKGSQRPLQCSMRKHGIENFIFEMLEECLDDKVDDREHYWISHFNSYDPDHGYNLTHGGKATLGYIFTDEAKQHLRDAWRRRRTTEVVCRNECGEVIGRYESASAASRETGLKRCRISRALNNHWIKFNGCVWRYEPIRQIVQNSS